MGYKKVKLKEVPTERDFWKFITERQRIFHKRFIQDKPAPWTKDPILGKYRFCNIYRELDYGTIWATENTLSLNRTRDRLFATIGYRCCNRPATFDKAGIPTPKDWTPIWHRISAMQDAGEQVFSTAYRASAFGPTSRMEIYRKILSWASENIISLDYALRKDCETLKEAWETICKIWGIGPFIAYEIINDLLYTDYFPQGFTEDDFVYVGPGAAHALEEFWDIKGQGYQLDEVRRLREKQVKGLDKSFKWLTKPGDITLANMEGCLCEFRKYTVIQNGGGHPRLYPGDTEQQARLARRRRARAKEKSSSKKK